MVCCKNLVICKMISTRHGFTFHTNKALSPTGSTDGGYQIRGDDKRNFQDGYREKAGAVYPDDQIYRKLLFIDKICAQIITLQQKPQPYPMMRRPGLPASGRAAGPRGNISEPSIRMARQRI